MSCRQKLWPVKVQFYFFHLKMFLRVSNSLPLNFGENEHTAGFLTLA